MKIRKEKSSLILTIPRFAFNKYMSFGEFLVRSIRKIPIMLWGMSALLGMFFVGMLVAFSFSSSDSEVKLTPLQEEREQNKKLRELIEEYEGLSDLYLFQGENVRVITDMNIIRNNPEEFLQAVDSMTQIRDRILVEIGRIQLLRKQIGLIDLPTRSK